MNNKFLRLEKKKKQTMITINAANDSIHESFDIWLKTSCKKKIH